MIRKEEREQVCDCYLFKFIYFITRVSFFNRNKSIMSSTSVTTITKVTVEDIRFPTSKQLDGSDAMSPDP